MAPGNLKILVKVLVFNTASREASSNEYSKNVLQKALKKAFAPEFLNRIDDIVMFNTLTKSDIHKIIDIELKGLYDRIISLGYTIKLSPAAKDFITDKGFDIQYGARPLKRAIQKYVEDILAEEIILTKLVQGDIINIDFDPEIKDMKIIIEKPVSNNKSTLKKLLISDNIMYYFDEFIIFKIYKKIFVNNTEKIDIFLVKDIDVIEHAL